MYRCYDIEISRLFVMDVKDIERGLFDEEIKPGFECFFSPFLDCKKINMEKVMLVLARHDCAQATIPVEAIGGITPEETTEAAPFPIEYIHSYPFEQLAKRTVGEMQRDIVFACGERRRDIPFGYDEDMGDIENSMAEASVWIYREHHPYGRKVIEERTTSFETPLGNVKVMGPDGAVPFKVTKLLNFHYPYGKTQTVFKVDNLYDLSISLDDLSDNIEYRIGCEGRKLSFCMSDERTECFTCIAENIAFGIGVYDPSDDWDKYPFYDPSQFVGYFAETSHGVPSDSPIRIIPVPLRRDMVKEAELMVGWLENWGEPREPWLNVEEFLGFLLT